MYYTKMLLAHAMWTSVGGINTDNQLICCADWHRGMPIHDIIPCQRYWHIRMPWNDNPFVGTLLHVCKIVSVYLYTYLLDVQIMHIVQGILLTIYFNKNLSSIERQMRDLHTSCTWVKLVTLCVVGFKKC